MKNALLSTKWYLFIIISALAFGLFFVQTGLDLYKTGQKGMDFVWLSGATGVAYGLLVIPFIGFFIWIVLKLEPHAAFVLCCAGRQRFCKPAGCVEPLQYSIWCIGWSFVRLAF